jgi:predicted nucleotidyltransferase
MRLTQKQITTIKSVLLKQIKDAKIFLFGSRVDPTQKGGDIDLFVKTNQEINLQDEIKLLTQLELCGIERKVDLVIDTPQKDKTKFFQSIQNKAILL